MYPVGKIDRNIFSCITEDIVTDEVIITEKQIAHIRERHPNDYERYSGFFQEIISSPDYILEANKPNTAVLLKEIRDESEVFKTILKIATSIDEAGYKNSIITFMKIDTKEWNRLLRNKRCRFVKHIGQ